MYCDAHIMGASYVILTEADRAYLKMLEGCSACSRIFGPPSRRGLSSGLRKDDKGVWHFAGHLPATRVVTAQEEAGARPLRAANDEGVRNVGSGLSEDPGAPVPGGPA